MVVAPGAGDREAEKRLRRDVDLVADDIVAATVELVAEREKSHGGERIPVFRHRLALVLRHFLDRRLYAVAGELVDDELVVGHVGVERLHDPIAVRKRVRET